MALREENLDGASGGGKTISDAQAEDAFRTILEVDRRGRHSRRPD